MAMSEAPKYSYFLKLQSDNELSGEDSESMLSCQNYETEFVVDTPDTDSKSDCSDNSQVEFELATSSDEPPILAADLSTESDNFITSGVIAAVLCDSSFGASEMEGGGSSSISESDLTKPIDYWTCIQCRNKNNNPLFRFCQKCFQDRKQSFPPRPRKRRLSKSITDKVPSSSQDSGITSMSDYSKEKTLLTRVNCKRKNSDSDSYTDAKKTKLDDSTENKGPLPETKELCICCNAAIKNGIFIHGNSAHMCFCYTCSLKTWKRTKRCPICNRRVNNVVKVFIN